MRICVAQTRPIKGNIQRNIEHHLKLIKLALPHNVDIIIFPELSITGYEPALANELATTPDDPRFNSFQELSDSNRITIGIGVPTRQDNGIGISLVLFTPNRPRETYTKKYLHPDEEPYFVSGRNTLNFIGEYHHTALAICYEISVPENAETAFKQGATIYLASVAKSVSGMAKAQERLAEISRKYAMTVAVANCVGYCDNVHCGGETAIWSNNGLLKGQLNDASEGLLIFDIDTQEVIEKLL
ncbi:carbon-nitrogen hydrolase family protein [Adhaeribacter aquaticus]|uniref:carbon-nitrogen hydrolase family protein n=1 Tax=Adhaeribacter aquaticus TaxID=299567 RepID=UPI000479F70E|nr:carbon-nitrogen hydrolase family protein [Adhaeribacter aquaticus]